ncbi:transposase, partial [Endozoicomonas atrinae]|uniref:transposase n=1 Tax=Endozoicomonas atrinae TaxID=1333660 RepID=UPI001EE723A3
GFPEAINTVFPMAQVQLCIVHQVRNSLKYVSYKDRKCVASDLIPIEFSNYCITAQSREHRLNSRPASLQRLFQASQQQSTIFS